MIPCMLILYCDTILEYKFIKNEPRFESNVSQLLFLRGCSYLAQEDCHTEWEARLSCASMCYHDRPP